MSYIQVVKFEHAKDGMELPLEDDNTLDMATLTSQFPNAIGLKFKAESGAWRALKVNACIISPPADGWSDSVKYVVTYKDDHKRKGEWLALCARIIPFRHFDQRWYSRCRLDLEIRGNSLQEDKYTLIFGI